MKYKSYILSEREGDLDAVVEVLNIIKCYFSVKWGGGSYAQRSKVLKELEAANKRSGLCISLHTYDYEEIVEALDEYNKFLPCIS